MADITCDVVKDLLPLYVDDVLSLDSKKIVKEHLLACSECTDYYHMLEAQERDYIKPNCTNDQSALIKIKKQIKIPQIEGSMGKLIFVQGILMCI